MVELGQRRAGMVHVGIGHGRVLAHDIHGRGIAGMNVVDDLRHRQPRYGREIAGFPDLGKGTAHAVVLHALVVGHEHRDQPGVRGALHVVLPPQRMQTGARPSDMAGHERQRDQAAGIVGAVHMLRNAHAPEDHPGARAGKGAGDIAQNLGFDAAERRHLFRAEILQVRFLGFPVLGVGLDILAVVKLFLDDHMHDRVQHGHVGARAELQHVRSEPAQADPARIHHDQLSAALGELLEIGGRDRVVLDRVCTDDDRHIGILDLVERGRDRARADVFHQRSDRRRMAKAGAVIDVVVTEPLADQLLEQIGLFVGAFRTAEAGHLTPRPAQPAGGEIERLFPAGLAEMGLPMCRIDVQPLFRRILAADQRLQQPVRVLEVIEPEPPLDAKPVLVARSVGPVDIADLVVLDLDADLAADAAEGADALHFAVIILAVAVLMLVHDAGFEQGTGRAGLDAFAAGNAGRFAHRVVEIKRGKRVMPPSAHAEDVVHLNLAAGPHAKPALDAGIQVDAHGDMAGIEQRNPFGLERRETALADINHVGHVPEMRGPVPGFLACRLVGGQKLDHHPARICRTGGIGCDDHSRDRLADTGSGKIPLALDLDHAGTAVAVGAVAGLGAVAQMRNDQAAPVGDLPDRLTGLSRDLFSIQRECNRLGHWRLPSCRLLYTIPHRDASPFRPLDGPHALTLPRSQMANLPRFW